MFSPLMVMDVDMIRREADERRAELAADWGRSRSRRTAGSDAGRARSWAGRLEVHLPSLRRAHP